MTQNAQKDRELADAHHQLREKVTECFIHGICCFILQSCLQETELTRKEAELIRAEETNRREQQKIQEMRQRVSLVCGVVCVVTRGPPNCRRLI